MALSYDCLGLSYASLKQFKEALNSHYNALNLLDKVYGPNHPNIAITYRRIGTIYEMQ